MMCMSFLALAKRGQVPNLTGHHERDMFSLYCIAYIILLFAKLTSDILLIVSLQAQVYKCYKLYILNLYIYIVLYSLFEQKNLAPLRLWLTVNLIMIFFTLLALSFCSSFSPTVNIVASLLIIFVCCKYLKLHVQNFILK